MNPTLTPRVGIILGSGLGAFAGELDGAEVTPYAEIAGFPKSTAIGHAGQLVVGKLGNLPLAVMAGRAHLYEGYTPREVTFGVRHLYAMGVRSLVVTNASGGVARNMNPGDLALITDHINLQGSNPLVGPDSGFPDMTEAYCAAISGERARGCGRRALGIAIERRSLRGRCWDRVMRLRQRSDTWRRIGADLVGMSTAP